MIVSYLENCSVKDALKVKSTLVEATVEKCLGSTRATRLKGIEILALFVEAEGKADSIVEVISGYLGNKSPKLVAFSISALISLVKSFGPTVFTNCKGVLQILTKAFAHSDNTVRQETFILALEMHKRFPNCLNSIFHQLKPVQVKEIQASIEANMQDESESSILPTRFTRSHKEQEIENASQEAFSQKTIEESTSHLDNEPSESIEKEEEESHLDVFENSIPVNVLELCDEKFWELLDSSKWKDKKEALDSLQQRLETCIRLEEGNYGELISNLSKKISDLNVIIVIAAAKCLEKIASSLRKPILQFKATVIPALVDRLKEKKQSVIDALRLALDSYFKHSEISFVDLVSLCEAGLGHKNPLYKSEIFLFLSRSLALHKKSHLQLCSSSQVIG